MDVERIDLPPCRLLVDGSAHRKVNLVSFVARAGHVFEGFTPLQPHTSIEERTCRAACCHR